jgi:ComF family protein
VAVGFTPYADPRVRSLIGAYKFHSRTQLAAALGEVLARAASASPTLLPDSAVLLVPIPLQRRRERERGFNQAEEIARLLQPRLPAGSEIVSPLVRARKTAQQASLAKADRRANVAGAFRAIGACDEGKTYLLVDDVMTSGETLVAAAQALRSAGARTIRAITLAYGSDD